MQVLSFITTHHTNFGGNMSTEVIIVLIVSVTVIFVVVLWQGMNVAKKEIGGKQTTQYEKMADQAVRAEKKAPDAQQKTSEALEEISGPLASIQKMLRDVQKARLPFRARI